MLQGFRQRLQHDAIGKIVEPRKIGAKYAIHEHHARTVATVRPQKIIRYRTTCRLVVAWRIGALLQRAHLANTLTPPPATPGTPSPDLLAVVDNDVGGNKAFLFVSEAISDVVAVQQNGTIQHTLTLRYSYRPTGNTHGSKTFSDEVQVFAPPGSVLIRRSGLSQLDATGTAYGRVVFGGRISMAPFTVRTVTFVWQAPAPKPPTGATAGGHAYRLLVTRQAGSVASFAVTIQLPSPANTVKGAAPLKQGKGSVSYQTSGALLSDLDLQVTWA